MIGGSLWSDAAFSLAVQQSHSRGWPRTCGHRYSLYPSRALGPTVPLLAADANGVQLPAGFTSRIIGRTGQAVAGTTYQWHSAPDGGSCLPSPGGGWVYASNSEVSGGQGGVSAIKFGANGSVVDAYSILSGTNRNCSGGPTPWGT